MIVCLHCDKNDNIKNHRENAKKHQQKHADVILTKSVERFAPALVGDTVMVPVLDVSNVPQDKEISLREAAHGESVGNGQGFFKCGCKTGCITGRCKCRSNNVLCNSRCHGSLSCKTHKY